MIARIALALNRARLQRELSARLTRLDAVIDIVRGKDQIWEWLGREVCDLLVVSRGRLPAHPGAALERLHELTEAPTVVVITDGDNPEERAELLAAGCQAVLDQSVTSDRLADALETVLHTHVEQAQQRIATRRIVLRPHLSDFVSNSAAMQAFVEVVSRVAKSDVSLLLLGETGVGKERLAQAIHNDGPRATGPFVAVNCGALPETLLESELFGHEEGAFTGAARARRGCFELAHSGTLFLDEIADLPSHLQVKLLRALQEREFRRLGGERTIAVDVRVMAATNGDLEADVAQGRFRQDLFYRLGVMSLKIPPLRERREDIPELVRSYLGYLRPRLGREVHHVADKAMEALMRASWPGNVRELINVMERAMLLCVGDTVALADLPSNIAEYAAVKPQTGQRNVPLTGAQSVDLTSRGPVVSPELNPDLFQRPWKELRRESLDRLERAYLTELLRRTGGRVGETAELAGIEPRSLYHKMRRHGLDKKQFRRQP